MNVANLDPGPDSLAVGEGGLDGRVCAIRLEADLGALVHRLGLRPEAELEGVDVGQVLSSALGSVPVTR